MSDISLTDPLHGRGLRVCMLVTNDMVSDSRVSKHADTLGRHGFQVTIICPLSQRTSQRESRSTYDIVRVRSRIADCAEQLLNRKRSKEPAPRTKGSYTRLIAARRKNLGWVMLLMLKIVQVTMIQLSMLLGARRTGAQVFCANDLDTLFISRIAAGFDRELVYDSHELWPDMLVQVPEFIRKVLRVIEGSLIKTVSEVMTVNEFIADVLVSRYRIKSPVEVVYNCPPKVDNGPSARDQGRKELGTKVALYHGGYSPEKGLENVVRASDYLLPDILLLFRGSGVLENELRDLASNRPNVRFEPPVKLEDVVNAARNADMGIVPYLPTNLCNYYASPNKLFEYILAGLPIAASDLPFLRKVILGDDIGVIFDARDPKSIANAINQLTREDALTHHRRNLSRAREKYSWKVESKKLLAIYVRIRDHFK